MKNSTVKNNVIIADFMGEKVDDQGMSGYDWDDLEYHISWDWLMPVVEKIQNFKVWREDTNKRLSLMSMLSVSIDFSGYYQRSSCIITGNITFIEDLGKGKSKFDKRELPQIHKTGKRQESQIKPIYKAVVEFINWYNNEDKS